jgi:ribose transport system ATP-binding protein
MLRLEGIRKSFGATTALRGVSLELAGGEVLALIGENGAGKSTLMRILSGACRPDGGRMEIAGSPYNPANPEEARARGVAMIYQELNLAPHLSVQENILLGAEPARLGWIDRAASRKKARAALEQLGHGDLDPDRPAGACSIAEQQVVEIARALVGRPRVLIMDEPTSSLTQADAERLFSVILRLRGQGVSVIYISHFLEECARVADRFTVLKDGETVGSGRMRDAGPDHLLALMTGREVKDLFPKTEHRQGPAVIEVRAAASAPRLKGASLSLHSGEIFGLAGLIGAGRTDLVRTIFGLDRLDAGEVLVVGARPRRATPRRSWSRGIGFLSEDRKEEGLMLSRSLADNLTMAKMASFGRFGLVSSGRQAVAAGRWIGALGIRCRDCLQPVAELSGGTQQKIALARLLEHPARILLLDEPTRGIDVGTKVQIYGILGELAAAGKAVLVVSSYLPELLGLCDTIGVMARGELAAVRPRSEWSEAEILRVATGATRNP